MVLRAGGAVDVADVVFISFMIPLLLRGRENTGVNHISPSTSHRYLKSLHFRQRKLYL
jgi:hypothetical protein